MECFEDNAFLWNAGFMSTIWVSKKTRYLNVFPSFSSSSSSSLQKHISHYMRDKTLYTHMPLLYNNL